MEYDVIIIGAGASGLTAAITAARQGCSVLVIEQKDKAGKKILATGNGKCNFTNLYQSPECYRSNDTSFAMKVLSCFDVSRTLQFFKELGIFPKERDGYLYPNSEQAASVVSVLLMECAKLKVHFRYKEKVTEIKQPFYTVITESMNQELDSKASDQRKKLNKNANNYINNKEHENIPNNKNKGNSNNNRNFNNDNSIVAIKLNRYYSKNIILSTGGCASPKLGSDGSGYQLAKTLGHTIIKPLPALVQLKSTDKYCKTVSGVRTNATVSAYDQGKLLATEHGEIIFTDYGISGIPVMQLSRFVARALDHGEKVSLSLDYLPEVTKEDLGVLLKQRMEQNPDKNLEEMLVGLFNHKLSYIIILESKLDPTQATKSLSIQDLDKLIRNMKEFKMQISDTNSFENAQVSSGGIVTNEIDEFTMESKISKGLYLTGELIDVDGTCGGYNLQWAWSSGYLAGKTVGERRKCDQKADDYCNSVDRSYSIEDKGTK